MTDKNELMNNTKWNEIRTAMYNIHAVIKWRTKSKETGYISSWDAEWFYHFNNEGYEDIEWLEISLENLMKSEILEILREIHVPGKIEDKSVKIYGHYEGLIDYI